MYQDQTSQAHARHWNTQGLARVCFGQLILGAAIQVLYLILGKHDPALSILTGFLMGFGSFGVLLGAMTRGNKKVMSSTLILPSLGFLLGALIAVALYFFV